MLPPACIVDDCDACFPLLLPPPPPPFLPCPVTSPVFSVCLFVSVSKVFSTAIKASVSSAAVPPSRRTLAANDISSAAPFLAAFWLDAAASAAAITLPSSLPSAIQRFACTHGIGTKARASGLSVVHSPVRATMNCESKKCARDILCFWELAERNSSYRSPKFALPPFSWQTWVGNERGRKLNEFNDYRCVCRQTMQTIFSSARGDGDSVALRTRVVPFHSAARGKQPSFLIISVNCRAKQTAPQKNLVAEIVFVCRCTVSRSLEVPLGASCTYQVLKQLLTCCTSSWNRF